MDFSARSYSKELLDRTDIPFEDIQLNMRELDTINTRLGGHAINISALKLIFGNTVPDQLVIAEIGCGGGDNLRAIHEYCQQQNITTHFIGIDINPNCIAFAKSRNPVPGCTWITSDYRLATFEVAPDIIFSSLFCHHFSEDDLAEMLTWMQKHSTRAFFINDLHRHWLAFHSIRALTKVFSRSYLVKHDAPLSVRRGFVRTELETICKSAALYDFSIRWKWAFRWLIISMH